MDSIEIKKAIEAILFAGGDPVPVKHISQALDIPQDAAASAADGLAKEYLDHGRGIVIKKNR